MLQLLRLHVQGYWIVPYPKSCDKNIDRGILKHHIHLLSIDPRNGEEASSRQDSTINEELYKSDVEAEAKSAAQHVVQDSDLVTPRYALRPA